MEANKKFIAQYTRSFFLPKNLLKGTRILVILYEFIGLLLDYIRHWDGGVAFPRDFTALIMLLYFIVVLSVSYNLASLKTFELSPTQARFATLATILFAIACTSSLFDTVMFWSFIYRKLPRITYFTIHFYIINFVLMMAECWWSLMVFPASYILFIALSAGGYVGLYFLWWRLDNDSWMVYVPHGEIPMEWMVVVMVLVLYVAAGCVIFGIVRFRDRIYSGNMFHREEKYHILDSQSFAKL